MFFGSIFAIAACLLDMNLINILKGKCRKLVSFRFGVGDVRLLTDKLLLTKKFIIDQTNIKEVADVKKVVHKWQIFIEMFYTCTNNCFNRLIYSFV
jgi:hypothetical protein